MNFDKQLDVFSRNLSEIRRNGRYSYQSFSEKLRVGKSTVQAIESGDYNITLSTLITPVDGSADRVGSNRDKPLLCQLTHDLLRPAGGTAVPIPKHNPTPGV